MKHLASESKDSDKAESGGLYRGTVKFYSDEKLYGFVREELTGEELYMPVAGLIDFVRKNDPVTFAISEKSGKREAFAVQLRKD